MLARLLKGVSVCEKLCLREIKAEEFSTYRNAERRIRGWRGEASRESDGWKAGPVRKRPVSL